MVSILTPVCFESAPMVSAGPRERVMADMNEPLEPIATTGPILPLESPSRRKEEMDREGQAAFGASGRAARKARLAATGGVLGAIAALSCCIMPLALFALGISGAWIANLTALAPYQPTVFGVTLADRTRGGEGQSVSEREE